MLSGALTEEENRCKVKADTWLKVKEKGAIIQAMWFYQLTFGFQYLKSSGGYKKDENNN
jgi:hypothetical protein